MQILVPESSADFLGYSGWMLLLMGYLIIFTMIREKTAYKRMVVSNGKETVIYKTFFGDKIVAETDLNSHVEYDYSAITSVKETKMFYLLGLKYGLHIILQKDVKCNSENTNFIEYLFDKCSNIKKKKVKSIMYKKIESIICLCGYFILFLFNLICFLI